MPATDPIADMLTRIRNAVNIKRDEVKVRSSKMAIAIAEVLKREGYILDFEVAANPATPAQNDLVVRLKYGRSGAPAINRLDRVSKPGCRVYRRKDDLKPVLRGLGVVVLSTPKGVLSDREAREANVGGEVLCSVD